MFRSRFILLERRCRAAAAQHIGNPSPPLIKINGVLRLIRSSGSGFWSKVVGKGSRYSLRLVYRSSFGLIKPGWNSPQSTIQIHLPSKQHPWPNASRFARNSHPLRRKQKPFPHRALSISIQSRPKSPKNPGLSRCAKLHRRRLAGFRRNRSSRCFTNAIQRTRSMITTRRFITRDRYVCGGISHAQAIDCALLKKCSRN